MTIKIRQPLEDEIDSLAACAAQWFSEAFEKDNTPEDLEAYLSTAMAPEKFRDEFADNNSLFLVAESGNQLVGYARLRFFAEVQAVDGRAPFELHRLYAAGDRRGMGIGTALLDACCAESAARGCDVLWLAAWEENPRAIAFYERNGFRTVGGQQFLLGSNVQNDLIMQKVLNPRDA